jgi:hypothetical protein
MGFITSVLAACYVLQEWIGPIMSKRLFIPLYHSIFMLAFCTRIKDKLRSGELIVPGDQWPIFLYAEQIFDREDPWKGLFRSALLVSVSPFHNLLLYHFDDLIFLLF